jgi:hypothetical protein
MKLKRVLDKLDKEHSNHPSEIELTLFLNSSLNERDREKVMSHLVECKRCRDIVSETAKMLVDEKEKSGRSFQGLKVVNNIDYRSAKLKILIVGFALLIFFGVPYIDGSRNREFGFKSLPAEKGVIVEGIDRSLQYWSSLLKGFFGNN